MDMSDYAADVAVSGAAYVAHGVAGFMLPQLIYKQLGPKAAAAAEEHIPGMQSLGLVLGVHLCMAVQHPYAFKLTVNPWSLAMWQYGVLFVVSEIVKAFFNWNVQMFAKKFTRGPLEFRENNPEVKNEPLVWADYVYTFFTEVWELIGNVTTFGWFLFAQEGWALKGLDEMTFRNTILTWWVALLVNDVLYALTHWAMHLRVVYPYIHKHHHRITVPSLLITDALNYHPIEKPLGFVILVGSLLISGAICGELHVAALPLYLTMFLFYQCLNHCDQDVQLPFPGLWFESGAHEMHHRVPTCNFGNYSRWVDQLAGTYREYRSDIVDTKEE